MIYTENLSQFLPFWEEYRINIFTESISHQLLFTDTFRQNQFIENWHDHIYFSEQLHFGFLVSNNNITQTLNFEQKFAIYHEGDITQFLYFTDSYEWGEQLSQILVFSETYDSVQAIAYRDLLEFEEVWLDLVPINDGFEDELIFIDGFQLDEEEKLPCEAGEIIPRGYIEFEHNSVIIRLRSPDFGDIKSLISEKTVNKLRSGVSNVYKSSVWVDEEKYRFNVSFNKKEQFDNFKTFLRQSLGQQVIWRTHEMESKDVLILNPATAFSEASRFNHQVSLELVEV